MKRQDVIVKIRFGFLKFENGVDDVYLLPTIGIGKYHSQHGWGWGWGIGIKFLKLQLAIRFLYPASTVPKQDTNPDKIGRPCEEV